jgi:hypothetical protein
MVLFRTYRSILPSHNLSHIAWLELAEACNPRLVRLHPRLPKLVDHLRKLVSRLQYLQELRLQLRWLVRGRGVFPPRVLADGNSQG